MKIRMHRLPLCRLIWLTWGASSAVTVLAQTVAVEHRVVSDPQAQETADPAAQASEAQGAAPRPAARVLSSARSRAPAGAPASQPDLVRVLPPVIVPEIRVPYGQPRTAPATGAGAASVTPGGTSGQ